MVDEHEFFKTYVIDVKDKRSRQRRSLFFSNNPTIRLLLKKSELYKMIIKYMSVVPEWAREVLNGREKYWMGERSIGCFDFHSLGKCSLGYICHCSQFKGLQNIKKNKIILFKNWNHAEEELRTKSFAWMYFYGRKSKRNSVETKINLLKN